MVKKIFKWTICILVTFLVLAAFRYFVIAPTIVKHNSMQPTLEENQRLFLNRTYRITHSPLKAGELVAFEAPSKTYTKTDADKSNPIAVYDDKEDLSSKFFFYFLDINKTNYIKRVIGVAGDHVKIQNTKVFVNGTELDETYLPDDIVTNSGVFYDVTVPEGYIYVLGDNRPNSLDSRELGCIPLNRIEGTIALRFWPFDVFGKVK